MQRLRDADALMAEPEWDISMFDKHSAEWNACARRYWSEMCGRLPVHYRARHHYIGLLQKAAEYYEFKNAEDDLDVSAKAKLEAKEAVQEAVAASVTLAAKRKAEAEAKALKERSERDATAEKMNASMAYCRQLLSLKEPRTGTGVRRIYSIFDD